VCVTLDACATLPGCGSESFQLLLKKLQFNKSYGTRRVASDPALDDSDFVVEVPAAASSEAAGLVRASTPTPRVAKSITLLLLATAEGWYAMLLGLLPSPSTGTLLRVWREHMASCLCPGSIA
jgi:hypothetical protein